MAVGKSYFAFLALFFVLGHTEAVDIFRMRIQDYKDILKYETVDNKATQKFAFAKHFQDRMVLQKAPQKANIYGFSPDIGQKVILQFDTTSKPYYYETTVKEGPAPGVGLWTFTLDPMPAGTSGNIKVESEAGGLTLNEVIFGDVWICSGQSNMQFTVSQMLNAEAEMADAHNYPNIRIMTVAEEQSTKPEYDLIAIEQAWTAPSNTTIGGAAWSYFSAVCWLYGKNIHKALGTPIGLVATDWGGTPVEAWSSTAALAKCGVSENSVVKNPVSYEKYLDTLLPEQRQRLEGPQSNSVLWNAMIHPILGMTIYGAIWYQGENDAKGAMMNRYNCTFPEMIADWRLNFNKVSFGQTSDSFPFGFVQLSANGPDPTTAIGFPDIRWHQTADYGYVPNKAMENVFMAVAMDLPDFDSKYGSIHPQDKEDVGFRLSLSGLAVAYKKTEIFQGPLPVNGTLSSSKLVLDYGKTWTLDVRDWNGFELLCPVNSTNLWRPTSIITSDQSTVTLYGGVCGSGKMAVGLRYAWRESPCAFKKCSIYETANGLPGPPFVSYAKKAVNGVPEFDFTGPTYL